MVKSSKQKEKLHQLYALYEQPLYRIAYAILHQTEQAEDAVSDAFLKIIPHLDQIESPDSPKTKAFLIQVIRNTAINQYRKNAKDAERLTNIDNSTLQVPSPHNEIEQFLQRTEQQESACTAVARAFRNRPHHFIPALRTGTIVSGNR